MKKILMVSKYFGYHVGGAEKSMKNILLSEDNDEAQISFLRFRNVKTLNAQIDYSLPKTWREINIVLPFDFKKYHYLNFYLQKKLIQKKVNKLIETGEYDEVWTYGLFAPIIDNSLTDKLIYFIRDEYSIGWNINYSKGLKRFIKHIYNLSEFPFFYSWKQQNNKQLLNSYKIVVSTVFFKNQLITKGIDPKKIHLKRTTEIAQFNYPKISKHTNAGIVMVGFSEEKGKEIFLKLAKSLPALSFYVFDRKFEKTKSIKNINYMPWAKDINDVFKYADIVIVPSKINENGSRMILESQARNIKVLASNRGGNPELIKDNANVIPYERFDLWKNKIESILIK